jgi:hypothetical protein|tara:strand:+ start:2959 stop:3543 length:585 start_codon:yes stop_codon:yes gene_type:complete
MIILFKNINIDIDINNVFIFMTIKMFSYFFLLFFIVSCAHKLNNFNGFISSVKNYNIVPMWMAPVVSIVLLCTEFVILMGLMTLGPISSRIILLLLVLLVVYTAVVVYSLFQGRAGMDCGCQFSLGESQLGWGTAARNTLMVFLALTLSIPSNPEPMIWMYHFTAACGAIVIVLLHSALDLVKESSRNLAYLSP